MSLLAFSLAPAGVGNVAQFLALGLLSVMLMGAAKSGFGGSVGMLSVPLMIGACGGNAPLATGIMLPILIACDYVSVPLWWRQWDLRNVRMLLPGMVLGIGAGWVALYAIFGLSGAGDVGAANAAAASTASIANHILSMAIGAFALFFVAIQVLRWTRGDIRPFRPTFRHGMIAGASAGFISTLAHTAGPIVNMYLLPQQMPKARFAATTVLYYWIGNQVKLIPYFCLGLLSLHGTLMPSLTLMPGVVAGALVGIYLHRRVNEKAFTAIVYVLLAGIGLYLVFDSAIKLWRG